MKKLVLVAVVLFMVVGLCSCNQEVIKSYAEKGSLEENSALDVVASEPEPTPTPEPTDGSVLHSVNVNMSVSGSIIGSSYIDLKDSRKGIDTWTDVTSQYDVSSGGTFYCINLLPKDKIIQADGPGTQNLYFVRDGIVIGLVYYNGINSVAISYKDTIIEFFTNNGVTSMPLPRLRTMDTVAKYDDDKVREAREWQASNCLIGLVCSKTNINNMPLIVYSIYMIRTDLVALNTTN